MQLEQAYIQTYTHTYLERVVVSKWVKKSEVHKAQQCSVELQKRHHHIEINVAGLCDGMVWYGMVWY